MSPALSGTRELLLVCGIVSSVLYVGLCVLVPLAWPAYSSVSQTVSELSAIDAPTRALWVPAAMIYTLLVAAFGCGVFVSASRRRSLRALGVILIIYGLFGLGWPPMHERAVLAAGGGTLTDTLHLVWAGVTVALMMAAIAFGAAAFGPRFRVYSIVTIVVLVTFGVLTGGDAAALASNLPTPLVGVWERINIGVFLLWVVVLATTLLRTISLEQDPPC